jgi:hypothetical protein
MALMPTALMDGVPDHTVEAVRRRRHPSHQTDEPEMREVSFESYLKRWRLTPEPKTGNSLVRTVWACSCRGDLALHRAANTREGPI